MITQIYAKRRALGSSEVLQQKVRPNGDIGKVLQEEAGTGLRYEGEGEMGVN